jgi:hypothetical protein
MQQLDEKISSFFLSFIPPPLSNPNYIIFLLLLSFPPPHRFSRANEIATQANRKTLSAADVLAAVQEVDFPSFTGSLNETLDGKRPEKRMH